MKIETAIMERLVQIIQNNEPISNPMHNRLQVYRDMVHFRFAETIENIYPILSAHLGEQMMYDLIREFIASGAKSPFIAKMAEEFAVFLRQHPKLKGMHFLEDLVWFEYGELDLLSREFHDVPAILIWEGHYRLSSSALVRSLDYRVHAGEFEAPCECSLLLYYHFNEERVYFDEITPFAHQLIEKLETLTLEQTLKILAKMYDLDVEILRESVGILVEKWCKQRVLIQYVQV